MIFREALEVALKRGFLYTIRHVRSVEKEFLCNKNDLYSLPFGKKRSFSTVTRSAKDDFFDFFFL
jgi:hypothetical protein